MVEREHGAERGGDVARDEAVAHTAGLEPTVSHPTSGPSPSDPREEERHRRVMASAERIMRKHRNVFAALAK